ncbi:bidirectional sugar transporter SWEET2-like [Punica granatum]|uniref:Bidirectional sugar transporter SWEET n=1 Tax=Punica granatum TaxID=22663 RepID=A0A6P8BRI1_PUNGR|nr:bidirectional sugar transporter SWEET2-like [Punica granatum]
MVNLILKDAAGVAGNIFALGLFVSPIPTFRRIIRNRSTENFSGLPYIYALLNCFITMWYGTPIISIDNILVMTVNATGAAFQLVYVLLFITCADKAKKVRMLGLLAGDIILFAIIVVGSLQIPNYHLRQIVVGVISGFTLISMFASPLFIINLVIRTRSVEFMPFYLSLSTFLMSTSFLLYGILNGDIFIILPNSIGTLLGMTQLLLYCYYKSNGSESSREPLLESLHEHKGVGKGET